LGRKLIAGFSSKGEDGNRRRSTVSPAKAAIFSLWVTGDAVAAPVIRLRLLSVASSQWWI